MPSLFFYFCFPSQRNLAVTIHFFSTLLQAKFSGKFGVPVVMTFPVYAQYKVIWTRRRCSTVSSEWNNVFLGFLLFCVVPNSETDDWPSFRCAEWSPPTYAGFRTSFRLTRRRERPSGQSCCVSWTSKLEYGCWRSSLDQLLDIKRFPVTDIKGWSLPRHTMVSWNSDRAVIRKSLTVWVVRWQLFNQVIDVLVSSLTCW